MGVLLSRFRRKQTTIEVLEGIDKEISRLQRNRKVNQDRQKHTVTSLLIYSIAIYVFAAVIFFCVYFPDTWQLRFLYSLPLLVFPFLVWGIKKLLHWYFVKRISSNDLALQQLREKKKQILEDVVETETYKRAREILEKFDPARLRKLEIGGPETGGGTPAAVTSTPGTVVQQRTVRAIQPVRGGSSVIPRMSTPTTPSPAPILPRPRQPVTLFPSTPTFRQPQVRPLSQSQPRVTVPSQPLATGLPHPRTPFPQQPVTRGGYSVMPPGLPMPRTVLPRERGTMDKLMDYLVGDGPENRYALICQYCSSHNGMALKEEFEYLSFRCCYCYSLNPAKKQRPLAPRLEFFSPGSNSKGQLSGRVPSNDESDDDEEEDEDGGDSDQGSAEYDTSAGISPLQSGKSPVVSTSAVSSTSSWSSSHRARGAAKPKENGDSQLQEGRGPVVDPGKSPVVGEVKSPVVGQVKSPVVDQSKSAVVDQDKSPVTGQVKGPVAGQPTGPVTGQTTGPVTGQPTGPVAGQPTRSVAVEAKGSLPTEVRRPVASQVKEQVPAEAKGPIKLSLSSEVTGPTLPSATISRSEEAKTPVVRSRPQQKDKTTGGQVVSVPGSQAATVAGNDVSSMRGDTVGKLTDISDNRVLKEGPCSPETTQGQNLPAGPNIKTSSTVIHLVGARQENLPPADVSSLVPQDGSTDGNHVTDKDQSRNMNSPAHDKHSSRETSSAT